MMHETTFYEAWGWLLVVPLVVIVLIGFVIGPFWVQFTIAKREPGTSDNFNFKNYLKWLFEGILDDTWKFLKVVLWIAAGAAGIVLLYFIWSAITSGIDQLSVKDVLVIIVVLLVLLLFKNNRQ